METSGQTPSTGSSSTLGAAQQDTLESILQRLLYRDTFGLPKLYDSNNEDIRAHIIKIEKYLKACNINNANAKTTILLNSLSDEMQMELCGLLDFKKNENNYEWLSEKLIELFQPKETELSPYVKLFSYKQDYNQTTREYLAQIRREGYRLLKNLQPEEREKKMIEAFCNGLLNKELRKAMKHREIETLDEAFNLIKKEKLQKEEDRSVRVVAVQETQQQLSDIEKLQNQISMMQKQLTLIVSILQTGASHASNSVNRPMPSQRQRTYAQVTAQQPEFGNYAQNNGFRTRLENRIKCYCCGREGHIARMCSVKCARCGRSGHRENRCSFRGNRNLDIRGRRNVRILQDAQNDDWADYDAISTSSESFVENFEAEPERTQATATLNTLMIHDNISQARISEEYNNAGVANVRNAMKVPKEGKKTKTTWVRKSYPDDVNQWADYIEGRTNKKPKTLISSKHSEKAANKPIVKGSCQGRTCKILCDSGAEVNVIDEALLKDIQKADETVKIKESRKSIKCANNSSMSVVGLVRLKLEFASVSKWCNFLVVKNLFPNVIVGIRTMRDMRVKIEPFNNRIVVSGIGVPFLSRVYAETKCGQGNEV